MSPNFNVYLFDYFRTILRSRKEWSEWFQDTEEQQMIFNIMDKTDFTHIGYPRFHELAHLLQSILPFKHQLGADWKLEKIEVLGTKPDTFPAVRIFHCMYRKDECVFPVVCNS
jgi:hypothetical protein